VRATAPDGDALMIRSSPAFASTHDIDSIAPCPLRQSGVTHVAAARHLHGLERMEDIKFAILEANGKISVIPYASPNTVAAAQAS
jgi:hypothetical protein